MKLFADEAWRTTWAYFKESKGGLWGLGFLAVVLFCVIFADLIAPFDPSLQNRSALLLPPIWTEAGHWPYILGTDAVGRDMLSRLIYGARYSMFIGFVVVSLAVIVGTLLGLLAGYYSGWLDTLIMRLMDVILAFPSLLLALGLVAVLGPGLLNAMYAIALVMLPHFVRLTRANVLSEKNRDYVIASRIVGASNWRLMFNTILPNCMAPLIVQATLSFSNAILDAAALGFLGMGAQPPLPEWGAMLAEAREFISRAWWVVTFPGLVGDALRDALDPRMRRS
jgi:dipeptide transport system permease protein